MHLYYFVLLWSMPMYGIECWPTLDLDIGLIFNASKEESMIELILSVNFQRIAYTSLWKFSTGEDCHCWAGQHQMICWSPNSHTRAQNKQLKLEVYSPCWNTNTFIHLSASVSAYGWDWRVVRCHMTPGKHPWSKQRSHILRCSLFIQRAKFYGPQIQR